LAETSQLTSTSEIARRFEDAGVAAIILRRYCPGDGLPPKASTWSAHDWSLPKAIAIPVIASGGFGLDRGREGAAGAAREKTGGRHRWPRTLRWPTRSDGGVGADPKTRGRRPKENSMFKVRVIPASM